MTLLGSRHTAATASWLRLFALLPLAALPAMAISGGAPPGMTGAPPGGNCTSCHTGSANSGPGGLSVEFPNGNSYVPGQTYKVRVTLSDPAAQRWGFEITARRGAQNLDLAGAFSIDNPARTQFSPGSAPGAYVTHTAEGSTAGSSGSNSWEVNWTAPSSGAGPVTFYAAGNAANNDGTNFGDSIYVTAIEVQEGAAEQPTGFTRILPQFAFGGGWYTALYFSNTTDNAVTITAEFRSAAGAALNVPLQGIGPVSSHSAMIPPKGTIILEAPNTGGLQQGWAKVILPMGVSAYGVFRQSVAGRADQEAVVPISEDSRQMANMVFDDAGFTTAIAVVNPRDQAVTVTFQVYSASGALLGTVNLNLAPHAREAFALRDRPELAGVTSQRGLARLSVPSGAVAALGLRFAGEALTSIPVDYQ
jgi:hypothetical protein